MPFSEQQEVSGGGERSLPQSGEQVQCENTPVTEASQREREVAPTALQER